MSFEQHKRFSLQEGDRTVTIGMEFNILTYREHVRRIPSNKWVNSETIYDQFCNL